LNAVKFKEESKSVLQLAGAMAMKTKQSTMPIISNHNKFVSSPAKKKYLEKRNK